MAAFFSVGEELINFSQVGEVKEYPDDLRIVYICRGGRKIDVEYDSQEEYDNALAAIAEAGSGGGGSAEAPKFTGRATGTVGGIKDGESFVGADMQTMWTKLLSPEVDPELALSINKIGPFPIGTPVELIPSVNITAGTLRITKLEFIAIQNGIATVIDTQTGLNMKGVYTDKSHTSFSDTVTFRAKIYHNDTVLKYADLTINFAVVVYHGVVDSLNPTIAEIKALNQTAVEELPFEFDNIWMKNKRVCYCQPSSLGEIKSIKDMNGMELILAFKKSDIEISGVTHNLFVMEDTGTLGNGKFYFYEEI